MVDFGDNIYEDSVYSNGMTGDEMHNFYAYWYNKGYHDAWEQGLGGDYLLFSRSGTAGSQAFASQFAGDHPSTFQGLRQSVLGGLSAATAGFSVWGSDIGGYGYDNMPPSADCYMRWLQFGTFSPLMRAHGVTDRNPWSFGAQAEQMFPRYYWLRENLLDAVYSSAVRSSKEGQSIIEPMAVAYPGQTDLAAVEDQYMFCGDLLVVPVLTEGAYFREIRLPSGEWTDLWTGKTVQGGQALKAEAPQDRIPVYIRAGAVLPVKLSEDLRLGAAMPDGGVEALLLTPGNREEAVIWDDPAQSVTYELKNSDGTFTVEAEGPSSRAVVMVPGAAAGEVAADGRVLERLTEYPVSAPGYYVDVQRRCTVIRLPDKDWTRLEMNTSPFEEGSLTAGKTAAASSSRSDRYAPENVLDGRVDTAWEPAKPDGRDAWLRVDLGEKKTVDRVILKWTDVPAANYTIQVSDRDGEQGTWTDVKKVEGGFGGIEEWSFNPVEARQVRVLIRGQDMKAAPSLYGLEVYEASASASGFPWWGWVLMGTGVCLAAAALTLICIGLVKRGGRSATA